ncbi:MAG: hypothetical protein HY791_37785 [Deltaproteobacteria bacterium]|nr:hypothetical protein [Deltaproteobacteria bacterium]
MGPVLMVSLAACETGLGTLSLPADPDRLQVISGLRAEDGPETAMMARWTPEGWVWRRSARYAGESVAVEGPASRIDFDAGDDGKLVIVELDPSHLTIADEDPPSGAELFEQLRVRASEVESEPGFGECGRCLWETEGPPALMFRGDVCPAFGLGKATRYTRGRSESVGFDEEPELAATLKLDFSGACACPMPPLVSDKPTRIRRVDTGPILGASITTKTVLDVGYREDGLLAILSRDDATSTPRFEVTMVPTVGLGTDLPELSSAYALSAPAEAIVATGLQGEGAEFVIARRSERGVTLYPLSAAGEVGAPFGGDELAASSTAPVTLRWWQRGADAGSVLVLGLAERVVKSCGRFGVCDHVELTGCEGRAKDAVVLGSEVVGSEVVGVTDRGDFWKIGEDGRVQCTARTSESEVEMRFVTEIQDGVVAACGRVVGADLEAVVMTYEVESRSTQIHRLPDHECVGDLGTGLALPSIVLRANDVLETFLVPGNLATLDHSSRLSGRGEVLLVALNATSSLLLSQAGHRVEIIAKYELGTVPQVVPTFPVRRVDFVAGAAFEDGRLVVFGAKFLAATTTSATRFEIAETDQFAEFELSAAEYDHSAGDIVISGSAVNGTSRFFTFDGDSFGALGGVGASGRVERLAVGMDGLLAARVPGGQWEWFRRTEEGIVEEKRQGAFDQLSSSSGVLAWAEGGAVIRERAGFNLTNWVESVNEKAIVRVVCPDALAAAYVSDRDRVAALVGCERNHSSSSARSEEFRGTLAPLLVSASIHGVATAFATDRGDTIWVPGVPERITGAAAEWVAGSAWSGVSLLDGKFGEIWAHDVQ